ncbi:MAG: transporter [Flavobacteriales bacterium]|nr:transporter [Flavobacteriales bacterium]
MKKHLVLLVATFTLASAMIAQGPWIPKQGVSHVQGSYSTIPNYQVVYIEDGTASTPRLLTAQTFSLYGEFGISERLGFSVKLPFSVLESSDAVEPSDSLIEAGSLSGIGNISLGGKVAIISNTWRVSFTGQVDLKTGSRNQELGLTTGCNSTTITPGIAVGTSTKQWFGYANLGYGYRTNNYHDLFSVSAELGYRFTPKASFIFHFTSMNQLGNGDDLPEEENYINYGLYSSIQEFQTFQVKLFVEEIVDSFGGFLSLGGGSGSHVAAAPAITVGIFRKW